MLSKRFVGRKFQIANNVPGFSKHHLPGGMFCYACYCTKNVTLINTNERYEQTTSLQLRQGRTDLPAAAKDNIGRNDILISSGDDAAVG